MRQYELTYLISDQVPESDLNKVTGKVCNYVTALGGKILKEEIWGRRKLAYPIKKQDFATYVTLNFNLNPEKANELERNIFLTGKIIRHLTIVTDYGQEELKVSKEDLVATEAIEEVVGGERSFEAVEGETAESKDLMLKRDEAESEKEKVEEKPAEETVEAPVEEKVEEKPAKKAKEEKKEKPTKAKKASTEKKEEVKEDLEADRLSKLDKELGDILGDDL